MENQQTSRYCTTHKRNQVEYIAINDKQITSDAACFKCVLQHSLGGESLLNLAELRSCNRESILSNWPMIENQNILKEYDSLDTSPEKDESPSDKINTFFSEMERLISKKIAEMKEKILTDVNINQYVSKDQLFETYNKLSRKYEIKKLVEEYVAGKNNYSEINDIVTNLRENSNHIQTLLEQNLRNYYLLKLEKPKENLNEILLTMDQIFQNLYLQCHDTSLSQKIFQEGQSKSIQEQQNKLSYAKHQDQSNKISQEKSKRYETMKEKMIELINIPTKDCNPQSVNQFENKLQDFLSHLSSLSLDRINDIPPRYHYPFKHFTSHRICTMNKQIDIYEKLNQIKIQKKADTSEILSQFQKLDECCQKFEYLLQNQLEEMKVDIFLIKSKYNQINDLTRNCVFIKSSINKSSEENQTFLERTETNDRILAIRTLEQQQQQYQIFYDKVIDPTKKYVIRVEFYPDVYHLKTYEISLGIMKKDLINTYYINSSLLKFTNKEESGFTIIKKGLPLFHKKIKNDYQMRVLEYRMCLSQKYFEIADFPHRSNITIADEDYVSKINFNELQYLFGVQYYGVGTVKIIYLAEVLDFVDY